MSILDKGINKVLKWESVDASISEMLNLIQTEIIEKSSHNDLRELEKGMRKTWVLGVGGGANLRYYPSANFPVRLCLQFNVFTHQLRRISLQDTINKKEYFIPSGKETCTKLQRVVLRRISQYSYDETDIQPKHGRNGKFLSERRKPRTSVLRVCSLAMVVAVVLGAVYIFANSGNSTPDTIAIVQNGYLGEYTDISVKEILDSYYGMLYENEEWDGGTTDSGSVIVQAKYFDEGMEEDATTIQFTMLNEECFKISAFVDPLNPVEKATDMLAAMNYNYVLAYVAENQSVVGDPLAENDFITRISESSGSAVQYGASADYSGNRATICELEGKAPLDVSVAMLLDNYGLLDMSYYWGANVFEVPSTTETDKTISTPELPVAEETLGAQEEVVYLLDLVNGTTGSVVAHLGTNIVYSGGESGSNTFYHSSNPDVYYSYVPHDWDNPEIQGDEPITAIRVEGNTPISTNLTANMTKAELDSVAWNTPNIQNVYVETYYNQLLEENICSYRIETSNAYITFEWYLDRGDGVEYPASSVGISPRVENDTEQTVSTNNLSLEGYVIESSGGLKIRSGPGTSYEEVGRLEPLEKVVIQEIQSDGTRDWGRIDRGWICMDYVEEGTPRTISNYDANVASRDIVSGEYYDSTQNVGIKITTDANGEYLLSYSASGVALNNIPLRFYHQNTPTDEMLMVDLGTYYPGYSGYVEFVVTGSSWYSYNSLIDGLDDSYGDYFSIEKIS